MYLSYSTIDETDVEDGVQFWRVNTFESVLKQKDCAAVVRIIKYNVKLLCVYVYNNMKSVE